MDRVIELKSAVFASWDEEPSPPRAPSSHIIAWKADSQAS